MNCVELRRDIGKLRADFEAANLEGDFFSSNAALKTFYANAKKISYSEDRLLKKYLGDFAEKNPEAFPFESEFSKKIEGFDGTISTITKLSDDVVLVGGYGDNYIAEARMLRRGEDGEWRFDEKKASSVNDVINTTVQLSDDMILVGMGNGTKILKRDDDGEWRFDGSIYGFGNIIGTMLKLSDDMVLVGARSECEARLLRRGEDGEWRFDKEKLDGFNDIIGATVKISDDTVFVGGISGSKILRRKANGEWKFDDEMLYSSVCIYAAVQLSDDMVFVGGLGGDINILTRDDQGEWDFNNFAIWGPSFSDSNDNDIISAIRMSKDEVFVGGWHNAKILRQVNDGDWRFDEEKLDIGKDGSIIATAYLPDGAIFAGGDKEARILKRGKSFEALKEHLEDIAKKSKVKV